MEKPLQPTVDTIVVAESPDLHSIGAMLGSLFPDLDPLMPIHILGSGFSSLVVETAAGIVFRIAKNQEAATRHAREVQLLPRLKTYLPLPIPDPQWFAGSSGLFPFGVSGYRKLAGAPLHPAQLTPISRAPIARALASFLHALHSILTNETDTVQMPGPAQFRTQMEILRAEVLPALRRVFTPQEYHTLVHWWDAFLRDPLLQQFAPVLAHGDLWYENILSDANPVIVTGVLDFEKSVIGDPAQDFATLRYFDQQFLMEVLDAYQAAGGHLGEHFDHRVQKYWELRDFDGVQFAVRFNDTQEFEDAIEKLRNGPILNL